MNLKSERGSVTIYVLSVTICITLILLSIFVGMMNKNSSQYKQIEQIYNEYAGESNNEKIDNVYEDTINATNGRVQISANFYKQSGEKYDLSEYTNESLTLKVSCSGGSNGEKAKITIGNKVVEYTSQGIIIDENCVIKIVYSGKQKTITVNGIDKTAPTASKTEVKNLTATGYDVYVYNVADSGSGVNRVQFPTWTESNGQDDIISDWVTNSKSTGTKQSDGTTWVYHVNTADHKNEYGKYNTHIYAYDNLENSKMVGNVAPTVPGVTVPGVTVTYNYSENGGTSATKTSATVGYNSAVDLTPTATKSGYTFVGWNTNKDATTALSSLNAPASGATLYAIFKKDITATYKYWNGSATTSTTKSATVYNKTTSATITAPTIANSSKDGITYTARGWSTSNTGNATIAVTSGGSQTISANTTYYGAYQATITATFYYHKGTDQYARAQTSVEASGIRYMNSSGVYINSNITIPTEVTASTGYYGTQYKGVANAVSSSTAVAPNTGTTKYYAFYNVGITYYYYNGFAHTSSTGIRTATTDGYIYSNKVDKEPTPSNYDGAAFSHWSYAVTKYSDDYKCTPTTTAVLELYAVYSKTVTATFNYYNGSAAATTTASGTKYYISKSGGVNTYNNNISVPSAVSSSKGPSGIAYSHISTTRTGSATTPNTSTGIYYAVYKKTVTATKKEYNNKTSSLTGTAYGYYDGKATNARINLGTSTASGYTFRGWSTSSAADATTVNATVSLVNNTTYYASYSSTPTISLTYNANSGSGAPGSQTGKITRYMNYVGTTKDSGSVTLTVSATKPTRSGYTFVSWNTKSDGTGTSYASGATLKTSANVTLYAIWGNWGNKISKSTSYVGYYADIDADGTVDGVIYADLAVGNQGSGQWNNSNGTYYTIPTVTEGLKDYYISKTNYKANEGFGTKDVISPTGTGKDRFYIMALTDIDGKRNGTFYDWYNAAYGKMSDYAATTSGDFGKGKSNTTTMISKWNATAYGAQNNCSYHKDMWGQIQEEVKNGWFVPSRAEWAAFGEELGISKYSSSEKYYENFGLSCYYWSSSQGNTNSAWSADFIGGSMDFNYVNNGSYVRLSATF